jgi:hypothetical protein
MEENNKWQQWGCVRERRERKTGEALTIAMQLEGAQVVGKKGPRALPVGTPLEAFATRLNVVVILEDRQRE